MMKPETCNQLTNEIRLALKKTNSYNARRRTKKVDNDEFWARLAKQKNNDHIGDTLKPVIKKIKQAFRAEFRHKKYSRLGFYWNGYSYSIDHSTGEVSIFMQYEFYWYGWHIYRSFLVIEAEDIVFEATKAGALMAYIALDGADAP